jgi:hypothetical protein
MKISRTLSSVGAVLLVGCSSRAPRTLGDRRRGFLRAALVVCDAATTVAGARLLVSRITAR